MIHTLRFSKTQHDRIRKAARINGYDDAGDFIKGAALNDATDIAAGGRPLYTVNFTEATKERIERAARVCGWKPGQGGLFVRHIILHDVDDILRSAPKRKKRTSTRRHAAT